MHKLCALNYRGVPERGTARNLLTESPFEIPNHCEIQEKIRHFMFEPSTNGLLGRQLRGFALLLSGSIATAAFFAAVAALNISASRLPDEMQDQADPILSVREVEAVLDNPPTATPPPLREWVSHVAAVPPAPPTPVLPPIELQEKKSFSFKDADLPLQTDRGSELARVDGMMPGIGGTHPYLAGDFSAFSGGNEPFPSMQADTPPRERGSLSPLYPEAARRQGLQGYVVVRLLIDESGGVEEAQIVESAGPVSFRQAVLRMAHEWTFTPATRDGHPVKAWATKTVRFHLDR